MVLPMKSLVLVFCTSFQVAYAINTNPWAAWSAWSEPSVTCGDWISYRHRECDRVIVWLECMGNSKDSKLVIGIPCPIDGHWTNWSLWMEGENMRSRQRNCSNPSPKHGGKECSGNSEESIAFGLWSDWSDWTSRNVKLDCGILTRQRQRECKEAINMPCKKDIQKEKKFKPCLNAIDGKWGPWSSWSSWSGNRQRDGTRRRFRKCDQPPPSNGGEKCGGPDFENEVIGAFRKPEPHEKFIAYQDEIITKLIGPSGPANTYRCWIQCSQLDNCTKVGYTATKNGPECYLLRTKHIYPEWANRRTELVLDYILIKA